MQRNINGSMYSKLEKKTNENHTFTHLKFHCSIFVRTSVSPHVYHLTHLLLISISREANYLILSKII